MGAHKQSHLDNRHAVDTIMLKMWDLPGIVGNAP